MALSLPLFHPSSSQGGTDPERRKASTHLLVWVVGVAMIPVLASVPARAQVVAGADATFATRYVWRGVTRATNPVLQPAAYVALDFGSSFLTAGGWWNLEVRRAGAHDHTIAGAAARGLGESGVWLDYAAREAAFDWRVALWHSRLERPSFAGLPAGFSTTEIHAAIATLHLPVYTRLSGWLDVDRMHGAYYEVDASYPLGTHPLAEIVGSLFVGGRAGGSHGLDRATVDLEKPFYFRRDGIVYYELYAQLAVEPPLGGRTVHLVLTPRYEFAIDPAARRDRLDPEASDRTRFFWFELSLSWRSRVYGTDR